MKYKFYVKIGKSGQGKFKVEASIRPNFKSMQKGYNGNYIPTIQIPIVLDIPECEFDNSHKLLEAEIKKSAPCIDIKTGDATI